MKGKGVLVVDIQTAILAQLINLTKQLVSSQLTQGNVSQIQTLKCDFCGCEHSNGNCVPNVESV